MEILTVAGAAGIPCEASGNAPSTSPPFGSVKNCEVASEGSGEFIRPSFSQSDAAEECRNGDHGDGGWSCREDCSLLSAASMESHCEGDEGSSDLEELSLVETAILRLLQREKAQVRKYSRAQGQERAKATDPQHGQRSKAMLRDLLLEVRALRIKKYVREADTAGSTSHKSRQVQESANRFEKPEQEAILAHANESLKEAVQAAAQAAVAAAEAAKAAAASMSDNSAAIESLVHTLSSSAGTSLNQGSAEEILPEMTSSNSRPDPEIQPQASDFAKSVQKQNRATNWILGLMLVTSAVWRLGTLSYVIKLQRKISNPMACVRSMFGGDKEEPSPKPVQIPALPNVSTLLQGASETGKHGLFWGAQHDEDGSSGGGHKSIQFRNSGCGQEG